VYRVDNDAGERGPQGAIIESGARWVVECLAMYPEVSLDATLKWVDLRQQM